MKLPLFRAAFKDQRISMGIYVVVVLFYGLLIMLAYLQVEQMLSNPLDKADGMQITEQGKDEDDNIIYELNWTSGADFTSHVAIGFDADEEFLGENIEMFRDFDESEKKQILENMVEDLNLTGYLDDYSEYEKLFNGTGNYTHPIVPIPIDGMPIPTELVYAGTNDTVWFVNSGTSQVFIVGLISDEGNITDITFRGPVTTFNLVRISDFDEYLEDNPMIQAILGEEFISFTTLDGFIALEYFSMWPLMLLIFMAIKTGGVVSKHVDDQSIDILLATGYSRFRFLNEKMLVVLVNLVLVVLAAWIGIILGIFLIGEPIPFTGVTYAFLGSIPLAIGIIGLSLLLSVLIDENSKTTGAILGLTIFMFMIQIVSNIAGWNDSLGYISLFTYYNMVELVARHSFDLVNVLVPTVIGVVSIIGSYILFRKKEIHA